MHLGGRPDGIMHHGGPHAHDRDNPETHEHGSERSLDLTLGLNGAWHDRQEIAGVRDDNTGGHVLYFTPGLRLNGERTTTSFTFDIPIATSLNGVQSEPDWQFNTSIGVKF